MTQIGALPAHSLETMREPLDQPDAEPGGRAATASAVGAAVAFVSDLAAPFAAAFDAGPDFVAIADGAGVGAAGTGVWGAGVGPPGRAATGFSGFEACWPKSMSLRNQATPAATSRAARATIIRPRPDRGFGGCAEVAALASRAAAARGVGSARRSVETPMSPSAFHSRVVMRPGARSSASS